MKKSLICNHFFFKYKYISIFTTERKSYRFGTTWGGISKFLFSNLSYLHYIHADAFSKEIWFAIKVLTVHTFSGVWTHGLVTSAMCYCLRYRKAFIWKAMSPALKRLLWMSLYSSCQDTVIADPFTGIQPSVINTVVSQLNLWLCIFYWKLIGT